MLGHKRARMKVRRAGQLGWALAALTLALCAPSAQADGSSRWPEEYFDCHLGSGLPCTVSLIGTWCRPEDHAGLLSILQGMGVHRAPDLIEAVALMWCQDWQGSDPVAWRQRAAFPLLSAGGGGEWWTRSRVELNSSSDVHRSLAMPLWLGISSEMNGTLVRISSTREGGGDNVMLRLIGKHWRYIKVVYGGAC